MNIRQAIDKADGLKPNQFTEDEKLRWLNDLDAQIHEEIIETHDGWDGSKFAPHESMEDELIAPFPYEELYVSYLKMKYDEENGDVARYNNSMSTFDAHYQNYAKSYNKKHMPIGRIHHRIY